MACILFGRYNVARRAVMLPLFTFTAAMPACRDAAAPGSPPNDPLRLLGRPSFQLVPPKQANWTRHLPSVSPPPRADHSMATAPTGVFVFGGRGDKGLLNDLWHWNGTTWTLIPVAGDRPEPRFRAPMAWDAVRKRLVLAGGCVDDSRFAVTDTWEFSPGTKTEPRWVFKGGPPSRLAVCSMPMAYDEAFGEIVLLAFDPNLLPLSVTSQWIWNGSIWTQANPLPKSYSRSGMAFHQGTGNLVICCGRAPLVSNDTWVGHAGRFSQRTIFGAINPQEAWGILTPYPPGGTLLLYGGATGSGFSGPTSWTGTQWVTFQFAFPFPGERQTATAYDAAHGNIVLFGGLNASGFNNDTWTWGRQVACVPLEGAAVRVGTQVECFFKLGTGADLVHWDADGFAPKRQTTTTARFHPNGPGPALIRVRWTDSEGEHSADLRFTVVHR